MNNEMALSYDISDLFDELGFIEKWQKVFNGLDQPQETGEYKWASLQVLRLWAPAAAIVVPSLAVLIIVVASSIAPPERESVEVMMMEPDKIKELEEIKEVIEEKIEPVEMEDVIPSDVPSEVAGPNITPGPPEDFSPIPQPLDSVAIVKSPMIFKGIYGSRSPGMRGKLTGGGGGGSGTEGAVYLALRWLKKYQETDGSWDTKSGGGPGDHYPSTPAMTGLALLTYLAHGETPASEEFGGTVERAIRWLVEQQENDGRFPKRDGHDYSHPIAAYALSEAFGMTQVPMIKEAATKSIDIIVKGQHGSGLWNYNCNAEDRNDMSYSGWCIQALKAAKMAEIEVAGLDQALDKAVAGTRAMYRNGAFAYEMKDGNGGNLASVGVLSLQLLGHGKSAESRGGMDWLNKNATFDWNQKWGGNPIYYWYYATQAKFHVGGDVWNAWNRLFSPQLVKNQIVVKGAGIDGKDIGYWTGKDDHCKSYVYNTTLCTLMLEVYYRYLPTFKPPEEEAEVIEEKTPDIKINI